MFEELKEKLNELDILFVSPDKDCLIISRDGATRMVVIYDEKYKLCAYYISNKTKDTIGIEDNIAELVIVIARYYEGEDT